MVLALIIIIGLVLLWVIISPCFEKIFNEQGDEKNEKR